MSGMFASVLIKDEGGTYAAGGTFTKALEFNSEDIAGQYERMESDVMRAGSRALRADRWVANPKGAAGPLDFDVLTRGFAGFMQYMWGSVTLGSTPTDSVYTHTAAAGGSATPLTGKSFALQAQRPLQGGDYSAAGGFDCYLYKGGKVTDWQLSNDVDGFLHASLGLDFQSETPGATFVSPTFPSGTTEAFGFVGGSCTINAVSVGIRNVSVGGSNSLNTTRYYLQNASTKKEPLEAGLRDCNLSFEIDFDSTNKTYYDTNVAAGTLLQNVVLIWQAATKLGSTGSSFPKLTLTLPWVRLDDGTPNAGGSDLINLPLTGKALEPAGGGNFLTASLITGESNVIAPY